MSEDKDMTEAELEADTPSFALSSITTDAAERLVPSDRDWEAIESKLLARIDAEIEDDEPSEGLAAITRESKTHLVPVDPNWGQIEKKLLRRIDGNRVVAMPVRWRGVAAIGGIAAAAAALIWAGRAQQTWSEDLQSSRSGGVLGAHEGSIRIGGANATKGQVAQAGDRIEVSTGGHAVFDQPGRVTWALEAQSRVRVTRTEDGLVLALEQGATEAQVVPVSSGEAFAVDISDSSGNVARVAVHGTHLRVARAGDHVSVDLTEGVVTVGRAPRSGSTYGTLVTAPAHVEFDVSDVLRGEGAVRVDHTPAAVRAAAALAFADKPITNVQGPIAFNNTLPAIDLEQPKPVHPTPQIVQVQRPANTPDPAPAVPDATKKVEEAVQSCFAQGASQLPSGSPEIHMGVSTDLELPVEGDGQVHTFHFTTRLSDSEQQCVARTVWATRFPNANKTITIHFDLSR